MRKIPGYLAMIGVLLLPGCERQTSWDLERSERFPVVDCLITNELKQHTLRLHWSSDELNLPPEFIPGAVIELSDGSNTVSFVENAEEPGTYITPDAFMAVAGISYRLTIRFGSIQDTAFASMTGVSPLEDIQIEASDGYFQLVNQSGAGASMTEVAYDWSGDPQYCGQYGSCRAFEVFYNLDNIDVSKEFAPEKQVILFPHNTLIKRRKYSLTTDHQRFIRSLLLETEWRGGFFDTEQGNVPTNFHHGIRGWFGVCSVVADSLYFN
jgi:hypothetical protein